MVNRREFIIASLGISGLLQGCNRWSFTSTSPVIRWNPAALKHNLAEHVENNLRHRYVLNHLQKKLNADVLGESNRLATFDELTSFHDKAYIDSIKKISENSILTISETEYAPYGGAFAYEAAASAAALAIDLLEDIHSEKILKGIALTRPPGHHATKDEAQGYCIFNNVAVAVKKLQAKKADVRVAVIDIDAHHGNGIQDAFYKDKNVFYISTHQDHWPHTGKMTDTGAEDGKGFTMNIPLPAACGDEVFGKVFDEIIAPAIHKFRPDMIVVANGHDTHFLDPNSWFGLSLKGHAGICRKLNELADKVCGGKIGYVLEGGYHVEVLASGTYNTYCSIIGKTEIEDPFGSQSKKEPDITELLMKIKKLHAV